MIDNWTVFMLWLAGRAEPARFIAGAAIIIMLLWKGIAFLMTLDDIESSPPPRWAIVAAAAVFAVSMMIPSQKEIAAYYLLSNEDVAREIGEVYGLGKEWLQSLAQGGK